MTRSEANRRPSDHGGDGGYEHRCRECGTSFRYLRSLDILKVEEKENADGDICELCADPTDPE